MSIKLWGRSTNYGRDIGLGKLDSVLDVLDVAIFDLQGNMMTGDPDATRGSFKRSMGDVRNVLQVECIASDVTLKNCALRVVMGKSSSARVFSPGI